MSNDRQRITAPVLGIAKLIETKAERGHLWPLFSVSLKYDAGVKES